MNPRRWLAVLGCVLGWTSSALAAQVEQTYPYAKIAMPEIQIGAGARIPAMAGAGAVASEDLGVLYWNPAGLGKQQAMEMAFDHLSWFQGINQETIMFGMPLGSDMGIAVGGNYLTLGSFEKTTEDVEGWMVAYPETYNLSAYGGSLGFGWALNGKWNLGLAARMFMENLGTTQKMAIYGDLGMQYAVSSRMLLGMTIEKIGSGVGGFSLPMAVKMGFGYDWVLAPAHVILLALDAELMAQNFATTSMHAGMEYQYDKFMFARVGYQLTGAAKPSGLTGLGAGFGIKAGLWTFEYAFVPQGELGLTHRISVGANINEMFKPPVKKKSKKSKTSRRDDVVPMPGSYRGSRSSLGSGSGSSEEAAMRSLLKEGMVVETEIITENNKPTVVFKINRDAGARIMKWKLILTKTTGRKIKQLQGEELPTTIYWDATDDVDMPVDKLQDVQYELILTDINKQEEKHKGNVSPDDETEESAAADLPGGVGMTEMSAGESKTFGPIGFDRDRAEIRSDAAEIIAKAAGFIRSHPNTKVYIEGYCDAIDEGERKVILSKARAEAVARYLTAYHKIPLSRILIRGKGDSNPIADNINPDERQKNRRVMITVKARKMRP